MNEAQPTSASDKTQQTSATRDRVRELNDRFRTTFIGGRVMLTAGIRDRPDKTSILWRVMTFEEFNEGNDPYGEHDFGAFEQGPDTVFWKLDYYNRDLTAGSSDPSAPSLTTRVLTVMLAEEY